MVEFFKTNIQHHFDSIQLKALLATEFPKAIFHFDLNHPNKLLRVEGERVPASRVVQIIKHQGFYCEIIETKLEP